MPAKKIGIKKASKPDDEAQESAVATVEPEPEPKPEPVKEEAFVSVVRFRTNKASYVYWTKPPVKVRLHDGRETYEGGEFVRSKKFLIELIEGEDDEKIAALRSSKRNGVDYHEIKSEPDIIDGRAKAMQLLNSMDESQIRTFFTMEELTSLGVRSNADKWQLIAAFLRLNKQFDFET